MKILDHIFESLEPIFWVKILQFLYVDPEPGSGILLNPGSGIRDGKKFGSGKKIFENFMFLG
jgi:hypothetical protein